ncbi:hypothetical protein EMPG_16678 [Blastomyces silverae]|uniref:Uncharacterized protein n=1 Tax=Blastomyces silverae TaxID=2060906 RepID=A0A0H1B8T8_9EURO|nr:hypothetical protein EMPG_16678 [Blastomyces silverae]
MDIHLDMDSQQKGQITPIKPPCEERNIRRQRLKEPHTVPGLAHMHLGASQPELLLSHRFSRISVFLHRTAPSDKRRRALKRICEQVASGC